MDNIDYQIIGLLKANGKLSNVELGEILHLSSQAVGVRRTKLERASIITKYTISSNLYKTCFIEIYLNDNNFSQFEAAISSFEAELKLYKISGAYCYLLIYEEVAEVFDQSLAELLVVVEQYARYKVNTSLRQVM